MKKLVIAFFVLAFLMSGVSVQTAYAMDCTKDTPIDQMGDWFATLGKKGVDKEAVLAKRKADRLAICAKKEAQKAAQEAKKSAQDMKKKMGF